MAGSCSGRVCTGKVGWALAGPLGVVELSITLTPLHIGAHGADNMSKCSRFTIWYGEG